MARRCLQGGALVLAILAGLFLGQCVACIALPAWLGDGGGVRSAPTIQLPRAERDFGTVPHGMVLRASFPITNAGTRRLILVEQSLACCGQSARQAETTLQPGEVTSLEVQADTSQWCGQMRKVIHYTTNDPDLPRFALTLSARVTSCEGSALSGDGGRGVSRPLRTRP